MLVNLRRPSVGKLIDQPVDRVIFGQFNQLLIRENALQNRSDILIHSVVVIHKEESTILQVASQILHLPLIDLDIPVTRDIEQGVAVKLTAIERDVVILI